MLALSPGLLRPHIPLSPIGLFGLKLEAIGLELLQEAFELVHFNVAGVLVAKRTKRKAKHA